jgi:hypothetical protein
VTESIPPRANSRRASSSGGFSPVMSSGEWYRRVCMPVRERFKAKCFTSGRTPSRRDTVISWPMGKR